MTELEELRVDLDKHIALCHAQFTATHDRHECMMRQMATLVTALDNNTKAIQLLNNETKGVRSFWSDMTGAARFGDRVGKVFVFVGKIVLIAIPVKLLWDWGKANWEEFIKSISSGG